MSEKMIRALRRRFILISFVSLLGAMLVIGILMYAANYTMTQHSVKNTLDLIVDSKGLLSGARSIHDESDSEEDPSSWNYTVNRFLNEIFNTSDPDASSPEFYYSTRYFAVLYDEIAVSGGARGCQILLSPTALAGYIPADLADLTIV